ncbi:MAG: cache domain-containing protein, partial [Alphaproteobacteria bacterium]|nr:cache domain-containing protein [Alphaproteobacteria bacterium]
MSILVVLGVAVYSATRNTVDLLQDRADLEIEVLSREVESLLESARDQAGFVARMLEAHEVDPDDPDRFSALLLGAMAADPAIGALLYIRPDGQALLAERNETLAQIQALDLSKDETTKAALSYGSANKEPAWVPPIYLPDYDSTVIVLQIPVYTDDRFRGVLAVALGMRTLSE